MLIVLSERLHDDIQCLRSEIQTKNILLREAQAIIYEKCDHIWIRDSIDIDLDTSKTIIYCERCRLNKPMELK